MYIYIIYDEKKSSFLLLISEYSQNVLELLRDSWRHGSGPSYSFVHFKNWIVLRVLSVFWILTSHHIYNCKYFFTFCRLPFDSVDCVHCTEVLILIKFSLAIFTFIVYALGLISKKSAIKGMGQRCTYVMLRKADTDLTKKAGMLTEDEVEHAVTTM